MYKLIILIANPIHQLMLCSPFHRLVSGRMMMLTFYGRKTGRRYSFPVYYKRVGDDIRFFTNRSGRWWLNLLRGTWVKVCLQGTVYDGVAEHIPAAHSRMVEALAAFEPGLSKEEAEKLADSKVMFHIRLVAEPARAAQRVPGVG